jgi:dCMP deaminase
MTPRISPAKLSRVRPDQDTYFMHMARLVASRSTCISRQVGCVLVNARNHVLATGYNGSPAGYEHCLETGHCWRGDSESGEDLDRCVVVHAEANALLQCKDVWDIRTCYCTTIPCTGCIKLLANTSCLKIVYEESYPDPMAKHLWLKYSQRVLKRWTPGE